MCDTVCIDLYIFRHDFVCIKIYFDYSVCDTVYIQIYYDYSVCDTVCMDCTYSTMITQFVILYALTYPFICNFKPKVYS